MNWNWLFNVFSPLEALGGNEFDIVWLYANQTEKNSKIRWSNLKNIEPIEFLMRRAEWISHKKSITNLN